MTRYLPIILMVLAALGAGIAIVPGAWELAFMKLRDKDFASAEKTFEDKFMAGDRSREVLLPLSELYVRDGRVDKAISVLTQYANAHPNDRDVTSRLAVLLQEAQQTARAIAALEKLSERQATAKDLRELDRLHDIEQNTDGRIRALTRLAKMGVATAPESLTLTNLLAASGKRTEAMTAAYNAIVRGGAKTPHELVQVFAALAIDAGRLDLIATAVFPWAKAQSAPAPLGAVASALVDKKTYADAIAMVEASAAFAKREPGTVVLAAQLETTYGAKEKAWALYDGLKSAARLPAAQDGDYVALALALSKTDAALAHISAKGVGGFSDALLLYAIGDAAKGGKTAWLSEFQKSLSSDTTRPLPAARVALALGEADKAADLARKAEAKGSTITLAQLYADLSDLESAARVFDTAASDIGAIASQDIPQATAVAIALKRGPESLSLADRFVAQDKGVEAVIQRTRALTLNGRATEALETLTALNAGTELAEVAEIEALAAAKRFAELRSQLVARLSNGALSAAQRTNLIFLLNDLKIAIGTEAKGLADGLVAELADKAVTGAPRDARLALLAKIAPARALPFLKSAAESDPGKAGYVFTKLLKDMGRTAELKSYLLFAARTATDAKIRDDYLYELLKQGAGREAVPLLAERARTDGAKWFFAYDEALAKFGTRAERLSALQAFAAQPGTTRELRAQIAYQLLNLGDKARAETMFRELAADSGPRSPEVRQLAFLWGPRPSADARAWLKARAENAPASDRAEWASLLVNAGDLKSAETALQNSTAPEAIAALAGIYAEMRDTTRLRTLIKSALPGADAPLATALAQSADSLSLSAEASIAYERAGKLGAAGRAAFFAGDYGRAIALLSKAEQSAETSFYWGEALTASNRRKDAAVHFRAALARLGHEGESRRMRVVALARLKDHAAAERELAAGSHELDDTDSIRSAYTGALLDQGDTRRAAAQLGN
jgi:thioredoxin-like negative regulator of GroEL